MSEASDPSVTTRAAERTDAPALASLMTELGYETRTAEMEIRLEMIMKDLRYRTFVAVSGGKICGMIGTFCLYSYEQNDPSGRIMVLVVSEAMRSHGVGAQLIAIAETDFAERNISRIAVNTHVKRKDAHQFYEKMGYERNGFRFVKTLSVLAD
jgi:GNAT superfamily N-acetyltransferase